MLSPRALRSKKPPSSLDQLTHINTGFTISPQDYLDLIIHHGGATLVQTAHDYVHFDGYAKEQPTRTAHDNHHAIIAKEYTGIIYLPAAAQLSINSGSGSIHGELGLAGTIKSHGPVQLTLTKPLTIRTDTDDISIDPPFEKDNQPNPPAYRIPGQPGPDLIIDTIDRLIINYKPTH